jgi:hypothetical protein
MLGHVSHRLNPALRDSLLPLLSTTTVSVLTLPLPFTLPRCFGSSRPFSALSLRGSFYMHQLFPAPTQFAQIDDAVQSLLINRF